MYIIYIYVYLRTHTQTLLRMPAAHNAKITETEVLMQKIFGSLEVEVLDKYSKQPHLQVMTYKALLDILITKSNITNHVHAAYGTELSHSSFNTS